MPTQPIEQTVQEYTYKRPGKSAPDSEFPLGPEQSKTRRDQAPASGAVMRSYLRDLLALAAPEAGARLTFADVEARHTELLQNWNSKVQTDLEDLGVDTGTVFRLHHDPAGSATVLGEHPDKAMINAYFAANPDKVERLGQVLRFGRLAAAAKNTPASKDMDRPMSAEAMAGWYADNMNTQNLFAPGGIVVGAGTAPYKGLDIRV